MPTLRRSGKITALVSLLALVALAAFAATGAGAEDEKPPSFDGGMSFRAIEGPDGPEEFSWTVKLFEGQTLVQIDDDSAVVKYDDDHTALHIEAALAHDAEGTSVPTTLAVSAPDVVTLSVHHRAGNPAAGGAPFHYPIVNGVGWEGGFQTYYVQMPPGEPIEAPASPQCVIPRLTGNTLSLARERVERRGCSLGAIRGHRRKGAKVVKQFRDPGAVLAAGARVAIKLG